MRFLSFLLSATAVAQQSSSDFQSQTREVLLEVVVRDARGKLVTKIDLEQVSVFEDGVKQDIRSFRLVPGREVRAAFERQAAMTAGNREVGTAAAVSVAAKSNPLR